VSKNINITEKDRKEQKQFNKLLDKINHKLYKYNHEVTIDRLGIHKPYKTFNLVLIDEQGLAKTLARGNIRENYKYLEIMSATIDLMNTFSARTIIGDFINA